MQMLVSSDITRIHLKRKVSFRPRNLIGVLWPTIYVFEVSK